MTVDCPKITEDNSSESRVWTPDARPNHSYWRSTKMRGLKPASQHHYNDQDAEPQPQDAKVKTRVFASLQWPRRRAWNLRLGHLCNTQTQSPKPASHIKLDAELEAHISTKCEAQALSQWLNAGLETRVSTTKESCVSVITALITGSITAHVMRELTPIMECFWGQFYLWNPYK